MTQGEALLILVRATGKAAFAGAFADRTVEERDAIENAMGVCSQIANSVLDAEEARKAAQEAAKKEAEKKPEQPAPAPEAKAA